MINTRRQWPTVTSAQVTEDPAGKPPVCRSSEKPAVN